MFKRPYLSLALNLSVWDFRLHWREFNWYYCMRSNFLQICTFWRENLINGMMQWLIFLWMLFSLIHDVGTEQEALRQNFIQVLEGSWRKENESTVGEIPSPPLLYLLQQYIWESCATLNVETGLNSMTPLFRSLVAVQFLLGQSNSAQLEKAVNSVNLKEPKNDVFVPRSSSIEWSTMPPGLRPRVAIKHTMYIQHNHTEPPSCWVGISNNYC